MIKVFRLSFIAGLLSLGLVLLSPHTAQAQGTDTILVLDASGSMWGQVDGQSKISAARQAVDSILSKWNPADRLGVMVYGHRSKGDCKDIELMVPVNSSAQPTACMSFNCHLDHFGRVWDLRLADGEVAHTACVGFGLERLTLALLRYHGFDTAVWPVAVRKCLWP